jgi:hypothetical protein
MSDSLPPKSYTVSSKSPTVCNTFRGTALFSSSLPFLFSFKKQRDKEIKRGEEEKKRSHGLKKCRKKTTTVCHGFLWETVDQKVINLSVSA